MACLSMYYLAGPLVEVDSVHKIKEGGFLRPET